MKFLNGLNTSSQITGAASQGTAPLVITSTTVVNNLNADMVDGKHASSFAQLNADGTFTVSSQTAPQLIIDNAGGTTASLKLNRSAASQNDWIIENRSGDIYITCDDNEDGVYDTRMMVSSWEDEVYLTNNHYRVWHEGNDGPSSGLDADTVDGKHSSDFQLSTTDITTLTDNTYIGECSLETLYDTCSVSELLYLSSSGYKKALAGAEAGGAFPCTAMCVEAGTGVKKVLKRGYFKNPSWSFTKGQMLYVSTLTAGGVTNVRPFSTGNVVQIIGQAVASNIIYFNPQYIWITI